MRYFNKTKWEPGWVAHTCNPSTREEGEEARSSGQPMLHSKLEAILGCRELIFENMFTYK